MDTEPYPVVAGLWIRKTGHVVVSVPLMRSGYGYGRRSRGSFRTPNA